MGPRESSFEEHFTFVSCPLRFRIKMRFGSKNILSLSIALVTLCVIISKKLGSCSSGVACNYEIKLKKCSKISTC